MTSTENGWNEYSRLVLEQLETLAVGIEAVRNDMQEMRQELVIMKAKEDKVTELRVWKEKIDDVTSPTQLKNLVDEVQSLREFKFPKKIQSSIPSLILDSPLVIFLVTNVSPLLGLS